MTSNVANRLTVLLLLAPTKGLPGVEAITESSWGPWLFGPPPVSLTPNELVSNPRNSFLKQIKLISVNVGLLGSNGPSELLFSLPSKEQSLAAVRDWIDDQGAGGLVWNGHFRDRPMSSISIVVTAHGTVMGSITTVEATYKLAPAEAIFVALANQAFFASSIQVTLRLVGTMEVDYKEHPSDLMVDLKTIF